MSPRGLFYLRLALPLSGLVLIVLGVVLSSGSAGFLTAPLVIVGALLLMGTIFVNRIARISRRAGVGRKP